MSIETPGPVMSSSSSPQTLEVDARPDRVVVRLARPERRNAIDLTMIGELHDVCGELERSPRPLLITGSEGIFAGGADIAQLRERRRDDALLGINSRLFDRIARLPQPTLAAVDGAALGGGAELALACDVRIVSPTAVFANPEPGLGIIAAAGACWRWADLVGTSVAKQVLLAGRRIDAATAVRLGLAMEVVEGPQLIERGLAIIDQMLKSAPLALRLTKSVLDAPGSHPLSDDLAQAILFESAEKQERMSAFLDRSGQ